MNITKLILRKIIIKKKPYGKLLKKLQNVKNSNDVPINSLQIGETITTNVKLIPNHFNTFLQVLLLN